MSPLSCFAGHVEGVFAFARCRTRCPGIMCWSCSTVKISPLLNRKCCEHSTHNLLLCLRLRQRCLLLSKTSASRRVATLCSHTSVRVLKNAKELLSATRSCMHLCCFRIEPRKSRECSEATFVGVVVVAVAQRRGTQATVRGSMHHALYVTSYTGSHRRSCASSAHSHQAVDVASTCSVCRIWFDERDLTCTPSTLSMHCACLAVGDAQQLCVPSTRRSDFSTF